MTKIANYFRDSFKELKDKVSWPTWPQLQQSTMIVLAATIVITFIVLAMDFVAGNALKQAYKILFKS
jgi:preprotein translocase subunit SecE